MLHARCDPQEPAPSPESGCAIAENPFPSLLVDITSRCNLACHLCYYRGPAVADLSVERFEAICGELPFPVAIKLAGGEPTLHPRLADLIRSGTRHGHTVYVASNGLRYAKPGFLESLGNLRAEGDAFTLGLSLDGGCSNAAAYARINGRDCLREKMQAFEALVRHRVARVCLTAIVLRGVNEGVIPELIELARAHPEVVRYLHFRNAANFGSGAPSVPYSIAELRDLVGRWFTVEQFQPRCVAELHCPPSAGRTCCHRFRPTARLQVSIIEFVSAQSLDCPKRGRLRLGADRIEPCFRSIAAENDGAWAPPGVG
jgi:molybdenum cofactor biosynthesis enzyme MoaA